jgi:hypothetical protein
VAKYEAEAILQSSLDRCHDPVRHTAVWAFVVTILDECRGGAKGPANVISFGSDGRCQGGAPLGRIHKLIPFIQASMVKHEGLTALIMVNALRDPGEVNTHETRQ